MTDPAESDIALADLVWEAAWNNDAENLNRLLASGARVDCLGSRNMLPVAAAIENWSIDALEILLRHGAAVGIYQDFDGWSPLVQAAEDAAIQVTDNVKRRADCRIIELLMRYGADPSQRGKPLGRSPQQYAMALCENHDTREIGKALLAAFDMKSVR